MSHAARGPRLLGIDAKANAAGAPTSDARCAAAVWEVAA